MLLYVTGNLENNGTITMTARGAKSAGQNVYLWKNEAEANSYEYVPAVGAAGGAGVYDYVAGKSGATGTARRTGRRRLWSNWKKAERQLEEEMELHIQEELEEVQQ